MPTLENHQYEESYLQELLGSVVFLVVRDGVLFRKWESERGDEIIWKLVLPDSLKTEVLKQLHDSPEAEHLGFKNTTKRVKARFYWCGLRKDVESWCVRCDFCASRKKPSKTPRAPMKTYNVGASIERIAIDVMGPRFGPMTLRFGVPRQLHTDQGRNFESR